jgi:hypothetical protein
VFDHYLSLGDGKALGHYCKESRENNKDEDEAWNQPFVEGETKTSQGRPSGPDEQQSLMWWKNLTEMKNS